MNGDINVDGYIALRDLFNLHDDSVWFYEGNSLHHRLEAKKFSTLSFARNIR